MDTVSVDVFMTEMKLLAVLATYALVPSEVIAMNLGYIPPVTIVEIVSSEVLMTEMEFP